MLVVHKISLMKKYAYLLSGAYEPPEGRKERPTPHYSVKRHLNLNDCDAFLIWTSTQVVQKCCFHNQRTTLQVHVALRALVMKTTLLDHLSLGPYKESVTSVQIQMPFHAVGRSFRPSGGSYAPAIMYSLLISAHLWSLESLESPLVS